MILFLGRQQMLSAGFWMTIATFPSKTVWSVELTVPFETEFQDTAESEETSYEDLVHKASRYSTYLIT